MANKPLFNLANKWCFNDGDGYAGFFTINRDGLEVQLPVTVPQARKLIKMNLEDYSEQTVQIRLKDLELRNPPDGQKDHD